MFLQFLGYKCQSNNINLTKIDEKWTTQLNCLTGTIFKDKIKLNDRKVWLSDTIIIDRDLNSSHKYNEKMVWKSYCFNERAT